MDYSNIESIDEGIVEYVGNNLESGIDTQQEDNIFLLEDGTKVLLKDGTLFTEDGSPVIFPDLAESEASTFAHQNGFMVSEEDLNEIITFDNDTADNSLQTTSDISDNNDQMLYIQNGDYFVPVQGQYQISAPLSNEEQDTTTTANDVSLANLEYGSYIILKEDGSMGYVENSENDVVADEHLTVDQTVNTVKCSKAVLPSRSPNTKTSQTIRPETKTLTNSITKAKNSIPPSINTSGLEKLLNKTITIGETTEGKRLIGKIVKIRKRTNVQTGRKTAQVKAKTASSSQLHAITQTNLKEKTDPASSSASSLERTAAASNDEPIDLDSDNREENDCQNPTGAEASAKPSHSLNDKSQVIVHKKVMTKQSFENISKTLVGLMNMDSVVPKLKNKTIIIKIIETTYQENTDKFVKTVSFCSGYMVKEDSLDETNCRVSEAWRFILDSDSRDVILAKSISDQASSQNGTYTNSNKSYANLSVHITTNAYGLQTTKVNIHPSYLFQCKGCFTSFRTSALLKLHSSECLEQNEKAVPSTAKSDTTSSKLVTVSSTDLEKVASTSSERKLYKCYVCLRQFSRYSNLQRHIEIHKGEGAMYQCALCNCSYHFVSSLTRHIVSAHVKKTNELTENTTEEANDSQDVTHESEEQPMQFLENDEIVEMIPLENISEETLRQYITNSINYESAE